MFKNIFYKNQAFIFSFIFFLISLMTLSHYGINWDTINHLPRGQAYLNFFLNNKKDFSNYSIFFNGWQKPGQWYWQNPTKLLINTDLDKKDVPTRSMYQNDSTTYLYFIEHDGAGHPPLSDIFSSFFNFIFFNKLRIVNDIDSYRIYGILLTSILVGTTYHWISSIYGSIAGFISVVALSTYPLFWAESHFNTEKDIPETVFFGLTIFSFWKGITQKKWKWILLSGIFAGFALGTKFNALFIIFIILPWIIYYLFRNKNFKKNIQELLQRKSLILSIILLPFIIFGIFVLSWPYLWPDIITRISGVFGFYKDIGTTLSNNSKFTGIFGINTYPLIWIFYTTPIVTLFLAFIGLIKGIINSIKMKDTTSIIFILWFIVPILRVIWPGASIYGGVRQIMEYIPAMAILAGIGSSCVYYFIKSKFNKYFSFLIILIPYLFLIFNLYSIHPNENVYFNELIGGLSGAKEKDIPYWGFSFGSPYRQLAVWINQNVEKGADLVYTFDLIPNLPRIWLRQDINLYNANRSGYLRKGEYAMGLVYDGTEERSYYDAYLEKFLNPVYEVKVDDVAIAKIWKNDKEHLKTQINEVSLIGAKYQKTDFGLSFNLGKEVDVSRLEISYSQNYCKPLTYAYLQISKDGKTWERLPGVLPDDWLIPVLGEQPKNGKFIQPFVGQTVRYVQIVLSPLDTCLMNLTNYNFFIIN